MTIPAEIGSPQLVRILDPDSPENPPCPLAGQWIDKVHQRQPPKELILDMDSSVGETYGDQEGAAYNGHFECTCYYPLFLFNQFGDLEYAMLRRVALSGEVMAA